MYLHPQGYQYYDRYRNNSLSYQEPCYYNNNYIYPMNAYYFQSGNFPSPEITKSQLELSNKIRELWEQHTVWTRAAIVSLAFDLPDVNFVTNKLLQNPEDFGNLFRLYYSDKIGTRLRDLLREHLVIAAQLVKASKAGDTKNAANIEKKWYANGDEIAAFLASINPYWSDEEWKRMLSTHLGLVKSEAVDLLTKKYASEGSIYNELENQALDMADLMTQGIIMQFPENFN